MILITGATGFVGRNIIKELVSKGITKLRGMAHLGSPINIIDDLGVEICLGDVTRRESLLEAVKDVETVVHTVGIIRETNRYTFDLVNNLGTQNVVETSRAAGVKNLIHVSAIGAEDNPNLGYAYSKFLGEQAVIKGGMAYTVLRPSIIFGEGDEFISSIAALFRVCPVIPVIGSGENLFQPISVRDVALCVAEAVSDVKYRDRVIFIGGPSQLSYNSIVDTIEKEYGFKRAKIHVSPDVIRPVLGLLEAILPHAPVTREQLKYLNIDNVTNIDNLRREFKIEPATLCGNIDYIHELGFMASIKLLFGHLPFKR